MQVKDLQMKRVLRTVLLLMLISVAGVTKTYAYDFYAVCSSGQILYFNIIDYENHYVEITCPVAGYSGYSYNGFTQPSGFISIPETIEKNGQTYTVTRIGDFGFISCQGLLGDLVIPNTVTSIGQYAFSGCTGFDGTITIPNSVTTIDKGAFYRCLNLVGTLTLPEYLTSIPSEAFYFCQKIDNVVFPSGLKHIGYRSFFYCTGLPTLSLPESLLGIGNEAFYNCTGLTGDFIIPNNVTTIGRYAFSECSHFNGRLTLGDSVETLEQGAFQWTNFTEVIFPNSLKTIGVAAFEGADFIGSLEIPNSVTEIDQSAFWECNRLTSVTIPSSVTTMEEAIFYHCDSLVTVNYNATSAVLNTRNTNPNTYRAVFDACPAMTTINIGENVVSIPARLFQRTSWSGTNGYNNVGEINCYAPAPPTVMNSNAFYNLSTDIEVHVPSCSIESYQSASYWNSFSNWHADLPCFCLFTGNGGNTLWSNTANWTIFPAENEAVSINANCVIDVNNVTVSNMRINEGLLVIPTNKKLVVTDDIVNYGTANQLVIEDGGELVHQTLGLKATMQKLVMSYNSESEGWHLIASPLKNNVNVSSVQNLLSNQYDLYYYDEPTHYWINQEYAPNNFTVLTNGKGYLYANNGEVSLDFAGELENGSAIVNIPLSYTETAGNLKGFNLVGNPFAHNVTSYGSVNVANGCYRMNEAKDDLIVSEISEETPLKPLEGFFVKATSADASITFNPGRGASTAKSNSIRIEVSKDNKLVDRLIVKDSEGQSLEKLNLNEQRTQVFAVQGQKEVAIVPCEGNEQPFSFKASKNGNYTISVDADDMDFTYLHLIDNLTGNDVNLLVEPSYSFEAKTTDYASRFKLVFATGSSEDPESDLFAFLNNSGNLTIFGIEGEASLQVVDVLGHVLSSEQFSDSYEKKLNVAPGVYVLRLINGDVVKTQKIIIK